MGKVYDNWGKLVEAVMLKVKLRELALCLSTISSSSDSDEDDDYEDSSCLRLNITSDQSLLSSLLWLHFPNEIAEFCKILLRHAAPVELNQLDEESTVGVVELIPSEDVHDLRCIAEMMSDSGYLRECIQVYASVRKYSAVYASLKKLNVEKVSIGDIQGLNWEILEKKISCWINSANVCVRVLFASERSLCKQIFEGLELEDHPDVVAYDACFMATIKAPAMKMFSFIHAISSTSRSPEKMFRILDLHDTLSDLMPEIDSVFESKSCAAIRMWAVEILSKLGEASRGMLLEFENKLFHEACKNLVPGGTIHPITRYVMNYVNLISGYKESLYHLVLLKPSPELMYSSNEPKILQLDGDGSTLALHLIWIITTLHSNLDSKSKHYRDDSLAPFFMMNNIHYILQKIKESPELKEMVGDDFLKTLMVKLRQAEGSYLRASLSSVLHCLRSEGLCRGGSFSSQDSVIRERFKSFNATFEEVRRTQATWIIPDRQLREELRISISVQLVQAYGSFVERSRSYIESGRHREKNIKYTVEELENAIFDFFKECTVPGNARRLSF